MSEEKNREEQGAENGEQMDAYRTSAKNWEQTFDAIVDPIYILSTSGEILRANRATADLVGVEPGTLRGQHCHAALHLATTFIEGCPFMKMKKSLRRESDVIGIQDRWFMAAVDPILDEQKNLLGAVHTLSDITELKKGQEAAACLAALVTSSESAIVSTTPDGIITSWNPGAETLTGYSREEMIGSPPQTLVRPETASEIRAMMAAIGRGERLPPTELVLIRKDGSEMETSLSVSPIRDMTGATIGVSWIGRDISRQRKAERALIAYLTEAALRLRNPVAIIRDHLAQVITMVESGEINRDEALMLLKVQVSNATQVLANIDELNLAIANETDEIPAAYRRFLLR